MTNQNKWYFIRVKNPYNFERLFPKCEPKCVNSM